MGAGVIPLAVRDGELVFLFQKTFTGRKVGYLIDFGGGLGDGEDYRRAAAREFVEETETLYFADDPAAVTPTPDRVREQVVLVDELFVRCLAAHPDWWRRRAIGSPQKPKDWRTYFIEFPYRDVAVLNDEWASDAVGRFKKRRELVWVTADSLLELYAHSPERLWKRVRQLEGAAGLVREIRAGLSSCN